MRKNGAALLGALLKRRLLKEHRLDKEGQEARSFRYDALDRVKDIISSLQSLTGNDNAYVEWPVKGIPQVKISLRGKGKDEMQRELENIFRDKNARPDQQGDGTLLLTISMKGNHQEIIASLDELAEKTRQTAIGAKLEEIKQLEGNAAGRVKKSRAARTR